MYVLNNEYDTRKTICDTLYKKCKIHDFRWSNQSYTSLATSLFKQMCGNLPESQYNNKARHVLDDFYPKALQWCNTKQRPQDLVNVDISKCYQSILVENKDPIPVYTMHDIIESFKRFTVLQHNGEFYIDETMINNFGVPLKLEAGFYSRNLVLYLVNDLKMAVSKIKWKITTKRALAANTFRNFMLCICKISP